MAFTTVHSLSLLIPDTDMLASFLDPITMIRLVVVMGLILYLAVKFSRVPETESEYWKGERSRNCGNPDWSAPDAIEVDRTAV